MCRNGSLVGEQVDVEEVTAHAEVVEDVVFEESAAKSTAVGHGLKEQKNKETS